MASQNSRQPIRVALIGLSSSAITSWASTAHLPYLLTPRGRANYTIIALCNSSVAAAQAAIAIYKLPSSTKAYGNPEDLAKDEDVDLVVCNTRVDKHFETVLPSLKAGKAAYIEWPVASNPADIETLVQTAKKSNAKTIIGLQGRWARPVLKIKEILKSGNVGKILSTDVRAFGGTNHRDILPSGLKYFAQREVGGNPITIGFAHMIDLVQSTVGNLIPDTTHSHLQLQRPNVRIRDPDTDKIVETVRSNVPDLVSLHGALPESATVSSSATLAAYYRRGQPFPGDPSFTWTLNCELGEIKLVAPSGPSLQADVYNEPVTIHVHTYASDSVESVPWMWTEAQEEIPVRARGVMSVYEAFAEGDVEGWVSIEDAAARARQIEAMLAAFENGN